MSAAQPQSDVTQLLVNWSNGDRQALEQLTPLVYSELRRLASRYLRRERPGHTLQSTALVHEAYMRLIDQRNVRWQNRAHFFGIAAQLIRRILVDHARSHHAQKRGADACKLSLDEAIGTPEKRDLNVVALDDALEGLARIDPATKPYRRVALLHRPLHRGDCRGARYLARHREARLGCGQSMALP